MNWLNTLFQSIGGAAKGAGSAIGGALKSGGNFLAPAVNAGAKVGQGLGNSLFSQFSGQKSPAIAIPKSSGYASPMAQPGVSNSVSSGLGSMAPQGASLLKKLNFNTPSLPTQTSQAQAPMGQDNGWMSQIFKGMNPGQLALGAGINFAGDLLAPKVKTPNIQDSASYQAMQNFKGGLAPGMEDAINRNLAIKNEEELRNLRNVYKNVRPGTDYTTDSAYQRDAANLQRNQTLNNADALAMAGNQYSSQEMNRLSQLANADLAQIMLETGMSAQEAEQFKQSFSNIGTQLISSAIPQQQGNLMEIFKMLGGQ